MMQQGNKLAVVATTQEDEGQVALRTAHILRKTAAANFVVATGNEESAARRAASCLLAPEAGDLVLLAGGAQAYILAVLERTGSAPAILAATVPSETTMLSAKKLVLQAGEDLEMAAQRTHLNSGRVTIVAEALSFVTKLLTQTLDRWQSCAKTVETIANDIATKAARRVTTIDETDVLEAETTVQKIRASSVTNANAIVIAAAEDLRLDGTRVTVG